MAFFSTFAFSPMQRQIYSIAEWSRREAGECMFKFMTEEGRVFFIDTPEWNEYAIFDIIAPGILVKRRGKMYCAGSI
jgi:hypothetical protein